MTEDTNSEQVYIRTRITTNEYTVAPGNSIEIPIAISNQSLEIDSFRLTITGLPGGWISSSSPVTLLNPGEEKEIELIINPPPAPQSSIGHYPFTIIISSQSYTERTVELNMTLHIAAYEVQGRIGVLLDSTQFSVAPGSTTELNILLNNQGLVSDEFRLAVEGIPANWISTSSPLTQLAAGEEKEVILTIRPPITPQSKAGRHRYVIFWAGRF